MRERAYFLLKKYHLANNDMIFLINKFPKKWEYFYHFAELAFLQDSLDNSLEAIQSSFAYSKSNSEQYKNFVKHIIEIGELDKDCDNLKFTINLLDKYIENQIFDSEIYFLRGYVNRNYRYCAQNEISMSEVDLKMAINLDSSNSEAYYELAKYYEDNDITYDHYNESVKYYQNAILLAPSNVKYLKSASGCYLGLGLDEERLNILNRLIEIQPDSLSNYYTRGDHYYFFANENNTENYFNSALNDFDYILKLDPNHAEALYYKGKIKAKQEQCYEAISFMTKAVETKPKYLKIFINEGQLFFKNGLIDESLTLLENAVELANNFGTEFNEDQVEALGFLGLCHLANNDFNAALTVFNKGIFLDSLNEMTFYNRGIAHIELGKYSDAIKDFSRAIDLNQEYDLAYLSRGRLFLDLNDENKACSDLYKAQELGNTKANYFVIKYCN